MTKKEFKDKCRKEKNICYKLIISGLCLALIGLVFVAISMFFIDNYDNKITGFVLGGVLAFCGMALDLVGEITFSKKYKEYNKIS